MVLLVYTTLLHGWSSQIIDFACIYNTFAYFLSKIIDFACIYNTFDRFRSSEKRCFGTVFLRKHCGQWCQMLFADLLTPYLYKLYTAVQKGNMVIPNAIFKANINSVRGHGHLVRKKLGRQRQAPILSWCPVACVIIWTRYPLIKYA